MITVPPLPVPREPVSRRVRVGSVPYGGVFEAPDGALFIRLATERPPAGLEFPNPDADGFPCLCARLDTGGRDGFPEEATVRYYPEARLLIPKRPTPPEAR